MNLKSRRFLVLYPVVLIGLAIMVVWAVGKLDWHEVGRSLSKASLAEVAAMGLAWMCALFIRPIRLMLLIRAISPEVQCRYWPVWSADLIAMAMNSIIPLRAGDMAMALVLRQSLGLRAARGFSAVLLDRFFDLLIVGLIFVVALSAAPTVAPWAVNLLTALPIGLAALAASLWLVIHLRTTSLALLDGVLLAVSPKVRQKWGERVHDFFDGLVVINRPAVIVPVALLSVTLWGATATSYWFGARAVWPDAPFAAGALTAAAIALSAALPTPPAGLGVFHAVGVLVLSLFNIPVESALACAIICHAFQVGAVLLLAFVALIAQGVSVRSLAALYEQQP